VSGRVPEPLTLLIANRATRTFGYGFVAVLLAIYLKLLGGDDAAVVASLGISLGSGAVLNLLVGAFGDRFGRRRAMAVFGLLMASSGVLLASAPTFPLALAALALGATSPTGTEVSPFLSVEQSIVAEVAREGRRTRAFAAYNLLGSLGAAAGALASGIPNVIAGGVPTTPDPLRPMFLVYGALGALAAILGVALPASVEIGPRPERVPLRPKSRSRIARISALFAVDSFAGGFVIQSFVSFWFYTTYPESREALPLIFFGAGVLAAFSFLAAARLGERFGLLETMVFTHIPSSVLLIAVPIAPGFLPALAAYLARTALSQMDVPTRQAYVAGIVGREERTAANAATNTARNVAQAVGPFSSGALIPALGLSFPFLIGGGLKIVYDLAIFVAFRRIRPETL
jgi:MFS family permease